MASYVAKEFCEMVGREIDLLSSLPKTKRDVKTRAKAKDPEAIKEAKKFDKSYFDGTREQGYGGYKYDGRWRSVAEDIVKFFKLKTGDKVLDIGCAKGFLVRDLMESSVILDAQGIDISKYALENCHINVAHRLVWGTADNLPFPDKSFDLVLSINTLHNLPRNRLIKALQEIERVSKGKSYIVVDSYKTFKEKKEFQEWVLTAEYHGFPEEWESVFEEAGYRGHYSWNLM